MDLGDCSHAKLRQVQPPTRLGRLVRQAFHLDLLPVHVELDHWFIVAAHYPLLPRMFLEQPKESRQLRRKSCSIPLPETY